MTIRSTWLRQASAGLVSLGVLGRPHPVTAQTPDTLRIATPPSDAGGCVYYAEALGYFKKVGLNVEITSLASGGVIAAGVASGSFDVGEGAMPSIASAHEHGIPFVIIRAGAEYIDTEPTSQLLVSKTSTIRTAADLTGKIVACTGLLNIGQIATEAWIDKHGGNASAVKFIELSFPDMLAALQAGRIDAGTFAEPFLSSALPVTRSIGAPYSALGSDYIISAWFTRADYVKTNPDNIRKFNEVMLETARWANSHRAESAAILERTLKMTISPAMIRIRYPERTVAPMLQPLIDASAKYKALKATFPAADMMSVPK